VCYEGFSACKRSAKWQTLKVHPVASKTLTQKRLVYAAPERLVGDFSFSIVFFLGTVMCPYPNGPIGPNGPIPGAVTSTEPLRWVSGLVQMDQSADFLIHTHSIFSQLQLRWFLLPETAGHGEAVSRCVSTQTNSQPGCVCVVGAGFGLGFAVSRCLADGHWAHREGRAGAPTSRLGQRVNTHTIQRCCMRNQCEFGTLNNINLF